MRKGVFFWLFSSITLLGSLVIALKFLISRPQSPYATLGTIVDLAASRSATVVGLYSQTATSSQYTQVRDLCTKIGTVAHTYNNDGASSVWQTSIAVSGGRDRIASVGSIIEIGLRNKFGTSNDEFGYTALVEPPNGTGSGKDSFVAADGWSNLSYPTDFVSADTSQKGPYAVIWGIGKKPVACDGFMIE